MINLNDEIVGKVEKMTFGGDGIIRFGEEKFVVFVKGAVVLDYLKVKIISKNKTYAKAEIIEIITPSKYRVKPICPIYNACGSCQVQNYDYDFLIEQKTVVLKDIFKDIYDEEKIKPVLKSPKILEYRNKIIYPCRETKNSKRVLIGYFKNNSHDLTDVKFCPIQPEIINKIAQFIRENYKSGCYFEKTNKGLLKNILFRINSLQTGVLATFILNSDEKGFLKYKNQFSNFIDDLIKNFPIIKGVFINFNNKKTNTILGSKTFKLFGEDYIIENLEDKKYKVGATGFFQVNPAAASVLFNIVKENIEENIGEKATILDAYGGVGAIGIFVSEKTKKITLVEENENAIEMAEDNYKLNNVENFEIIKGDVKKHLFDFQNENKMFDCVILDPPRAGSDKEVLDVVSKLTKKIIYVSCNPQTLKRDIIYLLKQNFKVQLIQGVDLFPYTYHIETVAVLRND